MSEITKDFIKFVAEVIVLLVVLAVVFSPEGIASNTFYYLIFIEPILIQNWLTSTLSIGGYSPGEFMASTETTGQAYTIKIYEENGITYAHVIPPQEYYLEAKFAAIKPTAISSNCRIYDQEIKLPKGLKQIITVKKVMNPDGTCGMFVGAPFPEIPIDRYPHISFSIDPEDPNAGDVFTVKIKYTHNMKSKGGVHLHWQDNQADFGSATNCPGMIHYDNAWNPAIMQGNELVECGPEDNAVKDEMEVSIVLQALVDDFILYYRTWDWSKDAHCRGDVFDYHREPLKGICSQNCDLFPDDYINCDTFEKSV